MFLEENLGTIVVAAIVLGSGILAVGSTDERVCMAVEAVARETAAGV